MSGTDTITIYRAEDVTLTFTMDPVEDISGWAISFTVGASGSKPISAVAAALSDPTNGVFTVTLTDTQTDLVQGVYQYDVYRTDGGSQRALAVGDFVVSDVARFPV